MLGTDGPASRNLLIIDFFFYDGRAAFTSQQFSYNRILLNERVEPKSFGSYFEFQSDLHNHNEDKTKTAVLARRGPTE